MSRKMSWKAIQEKGDRGVIESYKITLLMLYPFRYLIVQLLEGISDFPLFIDPYLACTTAPPTPNNDQRFSLKISKIKIISRQRDVIRFSNKSSTNYNNIKQRQ